jgi:hypothetical protein
VRQGDDFAVSLVAVSTGSDTGFDGCWPAERSISSTTFRPIREVAIGLLKSMRLLHSAAALHRVMQDGDAVEFRRS